MKYLVLLLLCLGFTGCVPQPVQQPIYIPQPHCEHHYQPAPAPIIVNPPQPRPQPQIQFHIDPFHHHHCR